VFEVLLTAIIGLYALVLGCGGLIAWAFQTLSHRLNTLENQINNKIEHIGDSSGLLTSLKDSMTYATTDGV